MKFAIQKTRIDLTIQAKETCTTRVLFSFDQEYLKNAKNILKTTKLSALDNLTEAGTIAIIFTASKPNLIVSLGSKNQFNMVQYHKILKKLATWLSTNSKITDIDIILEPQIVDLINYDSNTYIEQTIFHLLNNMYYFDKYKTKRKLLGLKHLNLVSKAANNEAVSNAIALLNGIYLTKDLGNTPPNIATPTYLAKIATEISQSSKKAQVKILDKKDLKELKMNAFLAVAQGSEEEPKLIVLSYNGAKTKDKPIVLVGKGVTFDSGGISIKGRVGMENMKYDMQGAATVLGLFKSVIELELPLNFMVVVPSTENLISGSAVKPSDIVTTMSGKTVEIINTDAEGRLILCDALTYVEKYNPKFVIDVATLTGACVTALGSAACGLYSNDEKLSQSLKHSGQKTNDKAWEMPLFDEYEDKLKSSIADLVNMGSWGGEAGSAVAAKFLANFVNYKWAHLDIAGVAWNGGRYDGSHAHGGATGRPFSLLIDFIRNYR